MRQYNNWKNDLLLTMPAYQILKDKIFKKSELINIEKKENGVLMWFDKYAGIDWIAKTKNNQVMGIASRIQWDVDYRTFTIRYERWTGSKTEYDKRMEAIENEYTYPTYTLQAYFKDKSNPQMLSCGIVKTSDLYSFIGFFPELVYENKSDNIFKYVRWDDMINNSIKLHIF